MSYVVDVEAVTETSPPAKVAAWTLSLAFPIAVTSTFKPFTVLELEVVSEIP